MQGENPLRAARLARGLSLQDITAETRLSPHIAAKIDAGRFAELPAGLYARACIRAVARAVGLDPEAIVAELATSLPDAPDPVPVLREIASRPQAVWSPRAALYLSAAIDGAIIGAITGATALAVDTVAGVRLTTAGAAGTAMILCLIAIVAVPYFLILAGVAGRTPGQQLAGAPVTCQAGPLTLGDVGRRAAAACLHESSILLDVLVSMAATGVFSAPLAVSDEHRV